MSEPAHSPLGASVCKRWMNCPGSVAATANIPEEESKYALEGTHAHQLAQECLENGEVGAEGYLGADFECEKTGKPWQPTPEMVEAVNVYLRKVWANMTPGPGLTGNVELYVERKFDLSRIHPGMFGRNDCALYCPTKQWLHVFDYKHGAGVPVEVEDNYQMKFYALGALFELLDAGKKVTTVRTTIVQPRCPHPDGPVRTAEYDALDLLDFAAELREGAKRTQEPNAPLVAGDWCKFCKFAGQCSALSKRTSDAAAEMFDVVERPDAFDAAQRARLMDEIDLIKLRVKAFEDLVYRDAQAGRMPAGMKWVSGKKQRSWDYAETFILESLKAATGVDFAEIKCPSPAQIEKKLGKTNYTKLVTPLVRITTSPPSLAKESDKRPAISLDDARAAMAVEAFDAFSGE